MVEHERDPDQFAIVCDPDRIVYASRPTRAEIERVLAEQPQLIAYFGTPRLVTPKLSIVPAILNGET